ncbi:MAG TPA: hypothetical protein VF669_03410 [Tepidisphaeraceae bacterium]|jgi:hypothetical protein
MDDQAFLKLFESRELPLDQWTHRAHVEVAYLYLRQFPFKQALDKMRAGVKAFNAKHNIPDSPTSGYNETTTHAFLHLIAATIVAYGETHPVETADAFCETHPQLMNRHALRLFYSPQQRMHPNAMTSFVPPTSRTCLDLIVSGAWHGRLAHAETMHGRDAHATQNLNALEPPAYAENT